MQINVNKKCSSFVIITFMLLNVSTIIHSVRLNLIDNGYEEVHVGVDFSIPEKSPGVLINAIKSVLNETSHALFIATNNRTYFRKVKIHVPSSWEAVTADEEATITDYYDVDFLVTPNKNSDSRETFTIQSGECGAPGEYTLVSQDFFTNEKVSSKGKILVQEWAKYRWGVFDEHGYQDDPEYPLFYVDSNGEVQPNYCANSHLSGTIVYPDSNLTCINNPFTGLPSDSCRFMSDDESISPVSSSLMSVSNIPSIEKFCDSSTHNSKLKNEHNDKCGGRSVWDVLDLHEDFLFNNNPPISSAPDPQFSVAKLAHPSYCIVIDDSSSMKKAHRSERVKKAVANWINYEVKIGSKIAIVSFSNEAETLHPLTSVIGDDTKMSLVNSIDLKSTGEISCLFCGLQRAINILDGTTNSAIILVNTDIFTAPISLEFMNIKTSYENKVVSISLIDANEFVKELIDTATNDFFIITDDDIGNMLDDALRRSVVVQASASKAVKIISETQVLMMPSVKNSGTFIIDSTLRNNLRVVIQTNDPEAYSEFEFLNGPSGEPIGIIISKVENVAHFTVPYAEEGVWRWEIQYYTVMKDAMLSVEVFVDLVDPSAPPISAKHWALAESLEDSQDPKVYLYSEVMQGDNPVIEAIVNVKLTSADRGVTLEKTLLDERMDDGIYSVAIAKTEFPMFDRYVAQFTVESHSTTKIVKRSINKKGKEATHIAFKRSEHLASPYLSDSKEKEGNLKIKRFKRQFSLPTLPSVTITSNTDSTTTNTGTTTTNTVATTANTGTTTTNTESTTTNTGTTTTIAESTSTTTGATTKKGGGGPPVTTTTTNTASTTANTESTTTNTAPITTNTASTTTNLVSTTTNTETTTTNTATTTTNTASTSTNTASTTPNTALTTTGGTGSTVTSMGTGSTTTGTGSTTTGTGSTTTSTGSTTISSGSTTTGTGSTTTSTGSTTTGTGSTTTGTGSTTTGTGSTTIGTGSTSTGTGSTTTGTGSTTTGSTTTGTGSTTTGTGSTTTGTGSTTTGTGSTTTGTGSTTADTGSTTTGTGSTTTGTGSTTTGTGSTTTGTGSTTTGTGSTTTGTGSTTTGTGSTTTGTGSTTTGTGSTTTGTGSTTTGTGSTTTGTGFTTTGTGSTTTGTGSTTTGTGFTTTGTSSTTTGTGSTTTDTGSTTTGTGSTTQSTSSTSTVAPTTSPITLIGLKTDSDTISPAAVTAVQAAATSANTVQISWTSTGDDGTTGKATAYQILLSTNQSDVQCQVPTNCSQNAIILSYVNSVSALAVIPTAGQPMNITYTSPTPLQSNVTYYVSVIPLDDSGNFGALSNVSTFLYVAPQPFDYQQYFATAVWPVLYQILKYFFSALYDICFAVIVGSTAGVFALAGLAIYFGGLREGDLELGLNSVNQFPDDFPGLMNFKTSPIYNKAPSRPSDDLSDIQGVRKIRGATPDDILFVWSPIQGFDFDGNKLYDESHS